MVKLFIITPWIYSHQNHNKLVKSLKKYNNNNNNSKDSINYKQKLLIDYKRKITTIPIDFETAAQALVPNNICLIDIDDFTCCL